MGIQEYRDAYWGAKNLLVTVDYVIRRVNFFIQNPGELQKKYETERSFAEAWLNGSGQEVEFSDNTQMFKWLKSKRKQLHAELKKNKKEMKLIKNKLSRDGNNYK